MSSSPKPPANGFHGFIGSSGGTFETRPVETCSLLNQATDIALNTRRMNGCQDGHGNVGRKALNMRQKINKGKSFSDSATATSAQLHPWILAGPSYDHL